MTRAWMMRTCLMVLLGLTTMGCLSNSGSPNVNTGTSLPTITRSLDPSPEDQACATLHAQLRRIAAEPTFNDSINDTLDRADRSLKAFNRIQELGCGPRSDYE